MVFEPSEPEDIGIPPAAAAYIGVAYYMTEPPDGDPPCGAVDDVTGATCTREHDHGPMRHRDQSDPSVSIIWSNP